MAKTKGQLDIPKELEYKFNEIVTRRPKIKDNEHFDAIVVVKKPAIKKSNKNKAK